MMLRHNKVATSISEAVRQGLSAKRKYLPTWLFYDKRGDELFREIMELPEYYLTRCEAEILQTYSDAIAHNFRQESKEWRIIEFGAGDGSKTLRLLTSFVSRGIKVHYSPVDISDNILNIIKNNLKERLPAVEVEPVHAEYLDAISLLDGREPTPLLVLFMGGNLGNFERNSAAAFLNAIGAKMKNKDRMIIGFDLMKSPSIIEKAYHDYTGVTTLFNKNLLTRINRELGADFDLQQFEHWPVYDAVTGACRSYLVSLKKQTVRIRDLNLEVSFKPWETIYTEISQKYDEEMIYELMIVSNCAVERMLFDHQRYFSVVIAKSISSL
jgi:L-histidine Nalpha-methyltransferase